MAAPSPGGAGYQGSDQWYRQTATELQPFLGTSLQAADATVAITGGLVVATNASGRVISTTSTSTADIAIQAAIDGLSSIGGLVHIKGSGAFYTISAPLTISKHGVILEGEGYATVLQCDGATVSPMLAMADTTPRNFIQFRNMRLQSSTAGSGTCLNTQYMTVCMFDNLWINAFNVGIDQGTATNYNWYKNIRIQVQGASGKGVALGTTCNDNTLENIKVQAGSDAQITGYEILGRTNLMINCNCEGGTNDPLIGMDIGAAAADTTCVGCYLEGNDTNLRLASGTARFHWWGGKIIDADAANITDNGAVDPYITTGFGNSSYVNYLRMSTDGSETNTTPVAGGNDTVLGTTNRYYTFFTLPTAAPYYRVTGIEWLNGTVVAGGIQACVERVDAIPPVGVFTQTMAFIGAANQSGTSAVQRVSQVQSSLIPGGTICGAFVCCNNATSRLGTTTVANSNLNKAVAYTAVQPLSNANNWVAGTEEVYIKVYYKPVFNIG